MFFFEFFWCPGFHNWVFAGLVSIQQHETFDFALFKLEFWSFDKTLHQHPFCWYEISTTACGTPSWQTHLKQRRGGRPTSVADTSKAEPPAAGHRGWINGGPEAFWSPQSIDLFLASEIRGTGEVGGPSSDYIMVCVMPSLFEGFEIPISSACSLFFCCCSWYS